MTKGKNKKMKITKIYLFCCHPLPSQDGGVVAPLPTPHPQLFPRQKFLILFFIDTWVSGQRVGKWTVWQSQQKRKNGTRENSEGGLATTRHFKNMCLCRSTRILVCSGANGGVLIRADWLTFDISCFYWLNNSRRLPIQKTKFWTKIVGMPSSITRRD